MKICPKCFNLFKDDAKECLFCDKKLIECTDKYYNKQPKKIKSKKADSNVIKSVLSKIPLKIILISTLIAVAIAIFLIITLGIGGLILFVILLLLALLLIIPILFDNQAPPTYKAEEPPEVKSYHGNINNNKTVKPIYGFSETRKIGKISIDEHNKLFTIEDIFATFKFSDLLKYDVRQGNTIIKTQKSNVVGRAIVGDMIFGTTGAIIGAATSNSKSVAQIEDYKLIIYTVNAKYPTIEYIYKNQCEMDMLISTLEYIKTSS